MKSKVSFSLAPGFRRFWCLGGLTFSFLVLLNLHAAEVYHLTGQGASVSYYSYSGQSWVDVSVQFGEFEVSNPPHQRTLRLIASIYISYWSCDEFGNCTDTTYHSGEIPLPEGVAGFGKKSESAFLKTTIYVSEAPWDPDAVFIPVDLDLTWTAVKERVFRSTDFRHYWSPGISERYRNKSMTRDAGVTGYIIFQGLNLGAEPDMNYAQIESAREGQVIVHHRQ